jgi:hypothetical protein
MQDHKPAGGKTEGFRRFLDAFGRDQPFCQTGLDRASGREYCRSEIHDHDPKKKAMSGRIRTRHQYGIPPNKASSRHGHL